MVQAIFLWMGNLSGEINLILSQKFKKKNHKGKICSRDKKLTGICLSILYHLVTKVSSCKLPSLMTL